MFVTVTVKMQAESKQELEEDFPEYTKVCRTHFDNLLEEGVFGPPNRVDIRYVIIGKDWRVPTPEESLVEEEADAE